ncbi:hypothetical protein [Helicobacter sp.]|nr:hypothetical protein [Helicobacter sp.]MDY2584739.1 hypothetical protein [Helicobacter sp.]
MDKALFDLTQPVGLAETWISIVVVVFAMWLLFVLLKRLKNKE